MSNCIPHNTITIDDIDPPLISISIRTEYRSSRQEAFCKKSVPKNFAKIHRKTPVSESTLFKKRLWQRCFPVNFAKFLRAPFL